jgi:hypothetical protein
MAHLGRNDPNGFVIVGRRQVVKGRTQNWKKRVKARARRNGLKFNLTNEDFFVPKKCPVFGIPLFFTPGKCTDNTPNLDRLIPSKGYVKGNVKVISGLANRLKKHFTIEQLRCLLDYMEGRR